MKIGIITIWQSNNNYGQLLQLWALQHYLKMQGHNPFLIRYDVNTVCQKKERLRRVVRVYTLVSKIIKLYSILRNRYNFFVDKKRKFDEFKAKHEGGNLAASKIRNLECPSYEICLIDYGCGKFNRKIHIMEQYP